MSFKSYNYNAHDEYLFAGTYTWTKPSDIDPLKPILVHVWGAGGAGNSQYTNDVEPYLTGGGGGGLAVKYISPNAIAGTVTVTCGEAGSSSISVGGTSSFGSHCSAYGGNGGANMSNNSTSIPAWNSANNYVRGDYVEHSSQVYFCMADNISTEPPNATYWSANVGGFGGIGVGGDINKRGGQGGNGYYASTTNCGGGGGGSAPAPYGMSNGFNGGKGYTYGGGGGAGIGAHGTGIHGNIFYLTNEPHQIYGKGNGYTGGAGGGSMYFASPPHSRSSYPINECGGNGLSGVGSGGQGCKISYATRGAIRAKRPEPATGDFIISDNEIFFGGGGGAGGHDRTGTTGHLTFQAMSGGPGGGGGGDAGMNTTNSTCTGGGSGGFLGGGGGSRFRANGRSSCGGNAGGGGGSYRTYTWDVAPPTEPGPGQRATIVSNSEAKGGDGIIIIQYARLFT